MAPRIVIVVELSWSAEPYGHFILRHCISIDEGFSPLKWLLLQVAQKSFSERYGHTGEDIFSVLASDLLNCPAREIYRFVKKVWVDCRDLLGYKVFPIILDEAQSLQHRLKNTFRSTNNPNESRSLLSPVIRILREPWPGVAESCVVPCGTGLGLLYLREHLESGIAKPQPPRHRFTDFGSWSGEDQVKKYTDTIIKFEDDQIKILYKRFRGHFRPLVSCIEAILTGLGFEERFGKLLRAERSMETVIYRSITS